MCTCGEKLHNSPPWAFFLHDIATSSSNKHMLRLDLGFHPKISILRPQLQNGYAYWCARTVVRWDLTVGIRSNDQLTRLLVPFFADL